MILLHRLRVRNFKQLSEVSLHFPESATILIEGHNEAGKSSLFEAVFFALYGQTLTPDRDYKLEDLRSYGAEVLEVELDFSVAGKRFAVTRKIGKNHTVKLIAPGENGESETISIRSEVSRRILEELRLSPDALLNTCFVEQKRLERLEDLNAEARRNTINELLNLRVLTHLDAQFRVSREDREALQRLRARLDIARLDDALPRLEAESDHALQCGRFTQLAASLHQSQLWQCEIDDALQRQEEITRQRESLRSAAQQAALLKVRLATVDGEMSLRLRAWQQATAAHARATAQMTALEVLAQTLPERERQLLAATALERRLVELEALEAEAGQLASVRQQWQQQLDRYDDAAAKWQSSHLELDALRSQRDNLTSQLEQEEKSLKILQSREHRINQLKLLQQHLRIYDAAGAELDLSRSQLLNAESYVTQLPEIGTRLANLEGLERQLRDLSRERQALQEVEASLVEARGQQAPSRIIDSILATVAAQRQEIVGYLETTAPDEQARSERVLTTLESVTAQIRSLRDTLAGSDTVQLAATVRELEAKQQHLRRRVARCTEAVAAMDSLGVDPDEQCVAAALQELRGRATQCAAFEADLLRLQELVRNTAARHRQEADVVRSMVSALGVPGEDSAAWGAALNVSLDNMLQESLENDGAADRSREARLQIDALNLKTARLETDLDGYQQVLNTVSRPSVAAELEQSDIQMAANSSQQATVVGIRDELRRACLPVQSAALHTRLALLAQDLERDRARLEAKATLVREAQQSLAAMKARSSEFATAWHDLAADAAPDSPDAATTVLAHLRITLNNALQQLNERALKRTEHDLQQHWDDANQVIITRRHQREAAQHEQDCLRSQLGGHSGESLEELVARRPALAGAAQHDSNGWHHVLEELQDAVRDNRSRRRAAAAALDLDDQSLNLGEATTTVAEADQNIAIKRRALQIVEHTRHSIVSRVMPLTMQNMRQLLPLLTDGRYQDVQWDEVNNYLAVYDSRARAFQRKRVFSGGARDQISLALRLAFALATLPGEHNARPGWLFLDEPLSSFDRTRTLALVDLVTRGLVRRHFAQVFLVSHSESFDPHQFDYRIRLDGGRIVESTLPLVLH